MLNFNIITNRILPRQLVRNNQGSILVESALVITLLLIPALVGVIEVSYYINTKERAKTVTNQVANVLISMPSWTGTTPADLSRLLSVSTGLMVRENPNITLQFCNSYLNAASSHSNGNINGTCGPGPKTSGISNVMPSCQEAFDQGIIHPLTASRPFVIVSTGCNYTPYFPFMEYLKGPIQSITAMPMRHNIVLQ